ncbi:hypothetical protein POJ06DRAFT_106892 [Lipomyces tetrasporus]|uniref:Uncharacterized protein n=1 Tax=Lipomyces tetrasporus TaxID=54092 RepID=A0AAD7QSM3_9ASCO|nr:uncharacterized protein POJ06DRAFT_106892 [Lipomyces tetrasporus]KAJ8100561.1 hypothetical protein POJ06DRAFT_106892 [Lipomyces tetrasporus]
MYQLKSGNNYVVGVQIRTPPTTTLKCRCTVSCEELVGTQTVQELALSLQPESIRMLQSLTHRTITEIQEPSDCSLTNDPGKSFHVRDMATKVAPQMAVPFHEPLSFSSDSLLDDEDFERLDEKLRIMTSSYPTALEPGNDITLDSDDERELNEPIIAKQDAVVAQSTKLQSTASKRQANEALLNKSENATVKFQKFSPLVNGPSLSTYSNLRTNDSNAGVPTPQPLLTNQDSLAAGKGYK